MLSISLDLLSRAFRAWGSRRGSDLPGALPAEDSPGGVIVPPDEASDPALSASQLRLGVGDGSRVYRFPRRMHGACVDPGAGIGGQLPRGDQLLTECDEGGGPSPHSVLAQPLDGDTLALGKDRQAGGTQLGAEHGPGQAKVLRHGFEARVQGGLFLLGIVASLAALASGELRVASKYGGKPCLQQSSIHSPLATRNCLSHPGNSLDSRWRPAPPGGARAHTTAGLPARCAGARRQARVPIDPIAAAHASRTCVVSSKG